jgi:hypothetical protein
MRGFLTVWPVLFLTGCFAHREAPRAWLVYVREVPVARVTLASASRGNVVDVAVQGGTADVTLRHSGPATLEPVQEPSGLTVALHQMDVRALAQGRYQDIERAMDEASWGSRDDLAVALLEATGEAELARVAEDEDGRRVLRRLYHELTAGSVWDDEREQALRVLGLWAQRIGLERFLRAVEDERTMVFPVRKPGPTVLDPVVPEVRFRPDGLEVLFSSKVYRYLEWQTLGGMHVRVADDAVVGVKLYDAGEVVRFVPALFLLEVSNAGAQHTLQKCGEMFALGLALGVGGAAGAGGRAASALRWCDRTALILGVALTVVDDHRGWILDRFGEEGARFLRVTDGLASLVAFYGLGRVAVAAPRAVLGLRRAYLDMKAAKATLSAEDQVRLDRIGRSVDELVEQAEKAGKGGEVIPIERARKPGPVPAVEEQPLRATGTEGRLVQVGGEPAGQKLVASAGDGTPKTALNPVPPSAQGTRAAGEGKGTRPVAPAPARESAITAALVQRGISLKQAQDTAMAAARAGVLDKVEVLVKSPGYRNPEKLRDFLESWNRAKEGKIQALHDAVTRLRKGHQVALEGGGADVVDYTAREAIQHKRIFGQGRDQLTDDLLDAAGQLRGEKGEVPPAGFTRIADIRFDAQSMHPLRSADRNKLRTLFPQRKDLRGVDRIEITTERGTFVFDPPFPIH